MPCPTSAAMHPMVSALDEALTFSPTSSRGPRPPSRKAPPEWVETLQAAADAGIEIVSGLHERLAPEFQASQCGTWGAAGGYPALLRGGLGVGPKVALTVGTDSAIGKMTATLEIERWAREAGLSPVRPDRSDGNHHRGSGRCVDAVASTASPVPRSN